MKTTWTNIIVRGLVASVLLAEFSAFSQANAADILWSSVSGSAWLTGTNWTGSSVPTSSDVAQFGTNPTSAVTGVGINMNNPTNNGANNQAVGAVEVLGARTNNFLIGNSTSLADGTFTLNGATVNAISNVVLRNASAGTFTVQDTQGGATRTMAMALGNATENKLVVDGTGNLVISSAIISSSGTTPLTIMGSGTGRVDITNTSNTFTGEINVNGAEVRFTADGSLGNAANDIVIDGGRFATASDAVFTLGAGRSVSVGDGAGTAISVTGGLGDLTVDAAIADKSGETGSWAKQGVGRLQLGGASTYTGSTAINNGTVQLTTGNNRLPTGTVLSLGETGSTNVGALELGGFSQEVAGLNSVSGTNANPSSNNVVNALAASTLTLSGSGSYTFGDGSNENSGIITGTLSLVKAGTGIQTLGDANTYTGSTTISGGTLALGANGSIQTSPTITLSAASAVFDVSALGGFSIASGQTLGGIGSVEGNVTLASGGLLAPGLSPGTLTFNDDLDVSAAGASAMVFELGSSSDMVDLPTGVLAIGPDIIGFSNFDFTAITGFGAGTFTLFQSTMPILGTLNASDLTGTISGFDATLSLADSDTDIVLTVAVPEPTSVALLAFGGVAFLAWNRKRRRSK